MVRTRVRHIQKAPPYPASRVIRRHRSPRYGEGKGVVRDIWQAGLGGDAWLEWAMAVILLMTLLVPVLYGSLSAWRTAWTDGTAPPRYVTSPRPARPMELRHPNRHDPSSRTCGASVGRHIERHFPLSGGAEMGAERERIAWSYGRAAAATRRRPRRRHRHDLLGSPAAHRYLVRDPPAARPSPARPTKTRCEAAHRCQSPDRISPVARVARVLPSRPGPVGGEVLESSHPGDLSPG